jgi:hypothetical protein
LLLFCSVLLFGYSSLNENWCHVILVVDDVKPANSQHGANKRLGECGTQTMLAKVTVLCERASRDQFTVAGESLVTYFF